MLEGDAWDPSSFIWKDSVYRFRKHGYSNSYFVGFSVLTDVKNSTYRTIYVSQSCSQVNPDEVLTAILHKHGTLSFIRSQLDQPALGLSREYLMKGPQEPEVQAYAKYQVF